MKAYVFEDGKYLVQRNPNTYEMKIYRHGEFWETATNEYRHNKMFHAMLNKVDELQESVNDLEMELRVRGEYDYE